MDECQASLRFPQTDWQWLQQQLLGFDPKRS